MKYALAAVSLAFAAACSPTPQSAHEAGAAPTPAATEAPAGTYRLDKSHASLVFRVNHLGFSNYTARFSRFDATLELDPENPTASQVSATIDARSLGLENPPAGFTQELLGPQWLGASAQPELTFRSTAIELTGPNTARITGDFTMKGVTKPVVLDATFNGGYAGHPMDPNARIGFSARGVLKRSDFGISIGIPAPGSSMGVGDDVTFQIEAEFTGPPLQTASTPPAQ